MKKDNEASNKDILQFENNFFQSKTKFEQLEERFKKTIFGVLNILLKFSEGSFLGEVLSLINETCQFLYYPFYSPVSNTNDHYYTILDGIYLEERQLILTGL